MIASLPLLLLLTCSAAVYGVIYEVWEGQSIQAAVDSAVTGDTVLIHDGNYQETVVLYGKTLTVGSLFLLDGDTAHISATRVTGTSLRPDTASAFVYAYGETADGLLTGLTLSGQGTWKEWDGYTAGGAVYIIESAARVHHCRMVDSWAQEGGGLDVRGSWGNAYAEVRDCEFRNCRDSIYAGGMHARECSVYVAKTLFDSDTSLRSTGGLFISASRAVVDSCEFYHCYGHYQGGMVSHDNLGWISNCVFDANGGPFEAAVAHLRVTSSSMDVTRNIFRNNSVPCYAVDLLTSAFAHRFFGNLIEGNVTTYSTGTLNAGNQTFGDVAYNVIRNNRNVYGGAFYAFANSRVRVHHNWFEGNLSDDPTAGSAVQIDSYSGVIDSNVIVNNSGPAITSWSDHQQIDARNNWWGHPSGPYHPTLNPAGLGDTLLSDSVLFIPWLTEPPDTSLPQSTGPRTPTEFPSTWRLLECYPNPFNSSVRIVLAGFTGANFEMALYNTLGQIVDIIHRGPLTGGELTYQAPAYLSSGVYFVKAQDRTDVQTRKIILMK